MSDGQEPEIMPENQESQNAEAESEPRKIAKTQLEVSRPQLGADKKPRVAKTILETDISKIQEMAIKAAQEAPQNAGNSVSEGGPAVSPPPEPRRVAKTMLETNLTPFNRKVAKTLLEMQIPKEENENEEPRKPQRKTRKIAKTVAMRTRSDIESAVLAATQSQEEPIVPDNEYLTTGQGETVQANLSVSGRTPVAKTMLDHDMMAQAVSKSFVLKESRVKEIIKEKAKEPVKTIVPVDCEKKAMPCKFTWAENDPRERFKHCTVCQAAVYNFSGLEMPEAEVIIFQRENLKKFTLYKRDDGKFMTRDCPRQVKKKRDQLLLIAGSIMLVATILTFLAMMPPPPRPAHSDDSPTHHGTTAGSDTSPLSKSGKPATTTPTTTTTTASDGVSHWHEGDAVPVSPNSPDQQTIAPMQEPKLDKRDESGEFWNVDPNEAAQGQYKQEDKRP